MLRLLAAAICCGTALAATPTTEYSLGTLNAKISLADSYIVLTQDNLSRHPEFLASRNTTEEAVLADWAERGVLIQAWVPDMDACLEIRAARDEDAEIYFNISAQGSQIRANYRASHLKAEKYRSRGYDVKSAEWMKSSAGDRYLQLKYKRDVNGLITWGYAEKTVKNGWTLVLDYQVFGRGLRDKDLNSVKKAARTVAFTETMDLPSVTKGTLSFSEVPPTETNTGTFTVEGTTTPGAHLIGVVMKYANPTPKRIETDASEKTGKFKLNIKLEGEGVWLLTLTAEMDGNTIAEHVFEPTTYQRTLLPVSLTEPVPEQFENDEFVLTGKTSKGVSIQCIVTGGAKDYDKSARTNNTGKFTFRIPTDTQSEYQITLVFQKKNYETRRFTWTANRTLSENDIRNQTRASAVKPAHTTLMRKMESYMGRTMGYKVYITDIQHVGDEYIVTAAMTKTRKGTMKDLIAITTGEKPQFVVGSEQTFYGKLSGTHEIQSEEDTEQIPSFELLFWD